MKILSFLIEQTAVGSVAIFPAAALFAWVVGPFLRKVGVGALTRASVYAVAGAGAGVWSYSAQGIPTRPLEIQEGVLLGLAMLLFASVVITPFVMWRERKRKAQQGVAADAAAPRG